MAEIFIVGWIGLVRQTINTELASAKVMGFAIAREDGPSVQLQTRR
jgi:hypothetical protein